jgi:prophage DNA circulation protein
MSTPLPPRPTMPRSSFAIAMKDYTLIRPGIAVTISAVTLVAALVIGAMLIRSLSRAAAAVNRGASVSQTLHRYNAQYEVWRSMAVSTEPQFQEPAAVAQRDSIRGQLQADLSRFGGTVESEQERGLVEQVLEGLASTDPQTTNKARQAMIVLLAHQDAALFDAAETSQRGVIFAAVLLALTILAAGMLIIPMAWLYVRYKRGAMIEVKV